MIEDYTIYEINLCVLADFLNKKIRARTRLKFKPYKLLKASSHAMAKMLFVI